MDNTSLTDKIKVAQGFLDSAQLLERTLNQIVAKSPEEAEMKVDDTTSIALEELKQDLFCQIQKD